MRLLTCALLLISGMPGQSPSPPLTAKDWTRADTVPQSFTTHTPHDVVRGRFTSSPQQDVAVLCSKDGVSSILVFRGGSAASMMEVSRQPDSIFLQVVASGGVIGYSRALDVANPEYIRKHHGRYGGRKPPSLDHDGINDIFIRKASVVWYWYRGRWLQLQGAD